MIRVKQKKVETVDAVQWWKDGDHPDVIVYYPEIVFSRDNKLFYVESADPHCHPKHWMSVAEHEGQYLPFMFFRVPTGLSVLAHTSPDLVARYAKSAKWPHTPEPKAMLRSTPVSPGMWIVDDNLVMDDETFWQDYEQVPEQT